MKMKNKTSRPHALVIPFPAQGHIGPMMQFSIKLATQEGFIITFANTQFNHAVLKKHMEPALQNYKGLEKDQVRLIEWRDRRRATGSTSDATNLAEVCTSVFSLQPDLEELVESLLYPTCGVDPLTLIVSDMYLYFTQDVANKYSLPRLAFWTASAGTLASTMAVKNGHRSPPEPERITWIPGVPPLKRAELNTCLQSFDESNYMFHHLFMTPYRRLPETTWMAINTFDELEHASVAALQKDNSTVPIYTIGPLLPAAFFEENPALCQQQLPDYPLAALLHGDDACIEWLNAHQPESVLYVSFGSVAVMTKLQIHELALGLEASGTALLWVVRADLMRGEDSIFPEGYVDRMANNRACFVEWAPQLQVLAHPSVGGFLTHCGWNSTLESLSAGVPMLGWPYFADQLQNNRCCIDGWGAALELEASECCMGGGVDGHMEFVVCKEEVEKKVRALMSTQSPVRVNARRWRVAAREAHATPGGSSYLNWKNLVNVMSRPK